MHCSANIDGEGNSALFFGLSGTGKTTLSSDRNRPLIGDDEHGWSDDGVFNFEGGCYAKVIRLNKDAEPDIWNASHRFGVVLENVTVGNGGKLDLDDASRTENTRSCYPTDFIPNAVANGRGGKPCHVLMLTADAFGVLPPVAKLTPDQAMYHFLSGYTARIAGTEKGLGMSRKQHSPPVSVRLSCRVRQLSMGNCSGSVWRQGRCPAGLSTLAGQAEPTARAKECLWPIHAPFWPQCWEIP